MSGTQLALSILKDYKVWVDGFVRLSEQIRQNAYSAVKVCIPVYQKSRRSLVLTCSRLWAGRSSSRVRGALLLLEEKNKVIPLTSSLQTVKLVKEPNG